MEAIYNWLIGEMGKQGDFQYQAIHIHATLAVIVVTIFAVGLSFSKKLSDKQKRKMLVGISIFQLSFEVLWRLIYFFIKGDELRCWWPTYPCNLAGIVIPLVALLNWENGKKLFYLFGFVGGVLTFAMPNGIFCRDVMVFPILKSILQHTGILLIPLFEFGSGSYRPSVKHMGWVFVGLLIHLVNCEGITRLLGFDGDYMFFRSGMPFVIPGVPQYITLSVFALFVLVTLSVLSDFVNKQLQKKKVASLEHSIGA